MHDAIVNIKKDLIKTGCYGTQFTSVDVHKAITEYNELKIEDLFTWKKQQKK